jgi:hypothetical protein
VCYLSLKKEERRGGEEMQCVDERVSKAFLWLFLFSYCFILSRSDVQVCITSSFATRTVQ